MTPSEKEGLMKSVNEALNDLRPHLAVDGGDIEVIDITEEMCVQVKWLGNCEACSMSAMTMKAGVEQTIKGKFPQIKSVEAINGVVA